MARVYSDKCIDCDNFCQFKLNGGESPYGYVFICSLTLNADSYVYVDYMKLTTCPKEKNQEPK
jgi:hypothetical protein